MIIEKSSGARVHLVSVPNSHEAYIGKSGMGKTWAICRRMEEFSLSEKKTLVLDWSGSFSEKELKKAALSIDIRITTINMATHKFSLPVMEGNENDPDRVVSLGENVLKINGALQLEELRKAATEVCKTEAPSLQKIGTLLKTRMEHLGFEEHERALRISKILDRMRPLVQHEKLELWKEHEASVASNITIVELSQLPLSCRNVYAHAILWALWQLIEKEALNWDNIIIDEAQHIDFTADVPSRMMREGRKYGLSMLLSTQFIGGLDKKAVSTMLQAGNIFYFRPDMENLKNSAEKIDPEKRKNWMNNLKKLQIGQSVLSGTYTLNNNTILQTEPIIVTHRRSD